MTKFSKFVAYVAVLCLGIAPGALAEPITVTTGSLVFPEGVQFQSGPLALFGTRGFSLDGRVDSGASSIHPLQCVPCLPSSTLSVGALISGEAFVETTATFDGVTYRDIGSDATDPRARAVLELVGSIALPELGTSPIVLTAPFLLRNSFFHPASGDMVPIVGSGTATLMLVPQFSEFWEIRTLRYDFGEEVVPEPATLFLVGSGIAGIALRARRRSSSR